MNSAAWLDRLYTAPNGITLIRPVGTGPFIWCCLQVQASIGYGIAALLLFGLIAASDKLDGWMARRQHQESAFGRVLDHLCDVGFILAALGVFAWQDWVPWWLPAAITWAFGLYALRSWCLSASTTGPTLIGSRLGHLGGILNYGAVGLVALDLCLGQWLWTMGVTPVVFIVLASLALLSGLEHLCALLKL
jgi:CDP-diacylglycerol--glycerol-3-phosphate 3-phosphatidyltransferase/cardiolipin synthase